MQLELFNDQKDTLRLADGKIFLTVQGEGHLMGLPSVFVRFAGCSVGCKGCDTNYDFDVVSMGVDSVAAEISSYRKQADWVWLTGGEPTDQDLKSLIDALHDQKYKFKIAMASSGTNVVIHKYKLDFVSISPHSKPEDLKVHYGNQINLVPSLNNLKLADWADYEFEGFEHKYVTPYSGKKESLKECLDWIKLFPDFKLGIQAHKHWGLK